MLNVITPLQKVSRGGATIADVLQQRFQDVFHRGMSSELKMKSEEIFTKSKEVNENKKLPFLWIERKNRTFFGLGSSEASIGSFIV